MGSLFYCAGRSPALGYAIRALRAAGIRFTDTPCDRVTHLLLPVPSFSPDGTLKGGGEIAQVLDSLPKDITVIGGNLEHLPDGHFRKLDLLKDPGYVAINAAITAHCALAIAMENLPVTLEGCPVLVVGWGRIGKCLARLLRRLDARVTVAARKEADRSMLRALGYGAVDTLHMTPSSYRVIFNTAPEMLLPEGAPGLCVDLASRPGIGGDNVIWARGLPGKDAPESSGKLIAETVLRTVRYI